MRCDLDGLRVRSEETNNLDVFILSQKLPVTNSTRPNLMQARQMKHSQKVVHVVCIGADLNMSTKFTDCFVGGFGAS